MKDHGCFFECSLFEKTGQRLGVARSEFAKVRSHLFSWSGISLPQGWMRTGEEPNRRVSSTSYTNQTDLHIYPSWYFFINLYQSGHEQQHLCPQIRDPGRVDPNWFSPTWDCWRKCARAVGVILQKQKTLYFVLCEFFVDLCFTWVRCLWPNLDVSCPGTTVMESQFLLVGYRWASTRRHTRRFRTQNWAKRPRKDCTQLWVQPAGRWERSFQRNASSLSWASALLQWCHLECKLANKCSSVFTEKNLLAFCSKDKSYERDRDETATKHEKHETRYQNVQV